VSVYFIRL